MRKLLLDTNVVLDVLLNRQPWIGDSQAVWQAIDEGRAAGYLLASSLTDVFYVARKIAGSDRAHASVQLCLEAFEICTIDRRTLEQALGLPGNDFEDKLQVAAAQMEGLDAIVSRDKTGFQDAPVRVLTPAEIMTQL